MKKLTEKPKLINVMGELWDFWPLLIGFDRDFDARFVSLYQPRLKKKISPEKIILFGEKNKNKLIWPLKAIVRSYRLIRIIQKNKPQYVVSHHDDANFSCFFPLIWCKVFNKKTKFIAWIHASPVNGYSDKIYSKIIQLLGRTVYNYFDHIMTPSQGNKKQIEKAYNISENKISVCVNPIDCKEIKKLAETALSEKFKKIYDKGPVIITVGRLTKQKGQWHLVRIFKEIKKKKTNAQLIILGEGELEDSLKKLSKNLQINDSVHFIPFQHKPYAFIAKANVFVLPSLWETFGNVIVESMACETPVVSTNCDYGPASIIRERKQAAGILVSKLSEQWLSEKEELTREEKELEIAVLKVMREINLRNKLIVAGKKRAQEYDFRNFNYKLILKKTS